jgi:hypothetical protein
MITLLTLEQLCGKNMALKEEKLVKEIHAALKHLYRERAIPYLHSCVQDIVRNSLARYHQLGLVQARSYASKKGTLSQFITCSIDQKSKIQELIEFLADIRPTT